MPNGTATTTTISRLSLLPPRARHRRLAMIMPTTIPAMMHSAYARSGKPNNDHTPVGGLGMESGSPVPDHNVTRGSLLTRRGVDLLAELIRSEVGQVQRRPVEQHRRRAASPRLDRRRR